eukprot:scaffold24474_cov127-Isochrysis_galbana.AAC.2
MYPSSYASDLSAASHSHSCKIIQSTPSRQSGMVQPVVNEMFATVHAAGSWASHCWKALEKARSALGSNRCGIFWDDPSLLDNKCHALAMRPLLALVERNLGHRFKEYVLRDAIRKSYMEPGLREVPAKAQKVQRTFQGASG